MGEKVNIEDQLIALRQDDYAVVIFTPGELEGVDAYDVEQRLTLKGFAEIETIKRSAGDDFPLFRLVAPDGKTWDIFENGRISGFPEGTIVLNNAVLQTNQMRGYLRMIQRICEKGLE